MRNTLYFLLAAAIVFLAIWQSSAPVAANLRAAEQQLTLQVQPDSLPSYDIRADLRAVAPGRVNQLGAAVAAIDSQSMQNGIESFREEFPPEARDNLRVVMNDMCLDYIVLFNEC
jgi:hypothetical protein